jgi:hypothetical protein
MALPNTDSIHPWSQRWQAVLHWWHEAAPHDGAVVDIELEPPTDSQPSIHWVTDVGSLRDPDWMTVPAAHRAVATAGIEASGR